METISPDLPRRGWRSNSADLARLVLRPGNVIPERDVEFITFERRADGRVEILAWPSAKAVA